MTLPVIAAALFFVGAFFVYRSISQKGSSELNALENKRVALYQRYEFMVNQRKSLRTEVKDKERQVATLRNSQHGIKTISASDLDIEETDENEKVSRYLLQEGKITLEQNEKVLKKMGILQMDYLGVCLTLGFIDIEVAKKAIKINKIRTKSEGLV